MFNVHVAGIIIKDGYVLLAKRNLDKKIYPGFWECGGGQLKQHETPEEGIQRELLEEFNVLVTPLKVLGFYKIPEFNILGIYFLCEYIDGDLPNTPTKEHTDIRWVELKDIKKYNIIPDLKKLLLKIRGSKC